MIENVVARSLEARTERLPMLVDDGASERNLERILADPGSRDRRANKEYNESGNSNLFKSSGSNSYPDSLEKRVTQITYLRRGYIRS